MDLGLKGKVAVITGGSVGIGLGIAEGLAEEGVNLVLCARNEDRLMEEVKKLNDKFDIKAVGVRADVVNTADIAQVVATTKKEFGGADILINNAGTGSEETIMEADDARWQYYWDLHVMAAVRFTRGLVPFMRERGAGVILNNASICAAQPLWYQPIYNTTKAALVMLSKTMSNEFIKDNIRVNVVNPGLVLTPDWVKTATILTADKDITPEQYLDKIAKDFAPIDRFASTDEIANLFVFLCSDRASYIVGSSLYIDGGWLNVIT